MLSHVSKANQSALTTLFTVPVYTKCIYTVVGCVIEQTANVFTGPLLLKSHPFRLLSSSIVNPAMYRRGPNRQNIYNKGPVKKFAKSKCEKKRKWKCEYVDMTRSTIMYSCGCHAGKFQPSMVWLFQATLSFLG